jgi:hypothetical protein
VDLWVDTKVSEKHIVSIFSPENQYRHLYRRENLKSQTRCEYTDSGQGSTADYCDNPKETSGSINYDIFEQLGNYQLLEESTARFHQLMHFGNSVATFL